MSVPAISHFFTTPDALRLHYLSWGPTEAPPVILLHGLRAYAQTWQALADTLAPHFRCYALDQRGRGLSDWAPAPSYCTEQYVADLEAFVEHLGLARLMLVGHSLGGANALEYARRNPGRLRALVIEDIGPGSSSSGDGAARIRREMRDTPAGFADWEAAREFWRRARPGISTQALDSRLAHSMCERGGEIAWRHDQQGIAWARLNLPSADLWPAVHALDCPTLFIRGGDSDFLPVSTLDSLLAGNPLIRIRVIEGASHYVHDDQSEAFNHAVVDFLQQQEHGEPL